MLLGQAFLSKEGLNGYYGGACSCCRVLKGLSVFSLETQTFRAFSTWPLKHLLLTAWLRFGEGSFVLDLFVMKLLIVFMFSL